MIRRITSAAASVLLLLATVASPASAAAASPAGLTAASPPGAAPAGPAGATATKPGPGAVPHQTMPYRTAAQLAGAGARAAGCAAPTRPGIAHCYLATEPAPAAAVHVLETGCTVTQQDGYSPCNIQRAYKLPSLAGTRGKGQTVAVIDAFNDPNAQPDLTTYRSAWGLPVCTAGNGCFKKVNQNGYQGHYPPGNMGWGLEISGDLDMVSAICPRCHILLVEATSNTFTNLFAAEREAVKLGAHLVSMSWGSGEFSGESAYDSTLARRGVEVTVSSGDGAYQGGVQYPSASPDVTSVGGTELTPAANRRGWIEKTWVTAGSNPPAQGSGSGCSAYESKPKWQKDHGCAKRTTADVSAVAANVLGYDSYESGGGGWYFFFGTSLSAPITAAVYGLAGNAAAQTVPGAVLPYSHRAHFYDITRGLATGTCSHRYLCKAVSGYDGPTGLGTPHGAGGF